MPPGTITCDRYPGIFKTWLFFWPKTWASKQADEHCADQVVGANDPEFSASYQCLQCGYQGKTRATMCVQTDTNLPEWGSGDGWYATCSSCGKSDSWTWIRLGKQASKHESGQQRTSADALKEKVTPSKLKLHPSDTDDSAFQPLQRVLLAGRHTLSAADSERHSFYTRQETLMTTWFLSKLQN